MTAKGRTKSFIRAGEMARLAGVSRDTLRHYERKGVLAPPRRSPNGYREYPPGAIDRVRLVRRALSVGFTLDELAQVLGERDKGGAPCRRVRALAEAKLSEVEDRLREAMALRDDLRAILKDWDERLKKSSSAERAGLLEALADAKLNSERGPKPLRRLVPRRKNKAKESSL